MVKLPEGWQCVLQNVMLSDSQPEHSGLIALWLTNLCMGLSIFFDTSPPYCHGLKLNRTDLTLAAVQRCR